MSVHQFIAPKNTSPLRDRALRAAACAIVRSFWELVLLEEPVVAEAVRTAERYVWREADDDQLAKARAAATLGADCTGWHPCRFIRLGGMLQACRFATRAACRATCVDSAEKSLEQTIVWASIALASRDHDGSPPEAILSELLTMWRRGGRWGRVCRLTLEQHIDVVEFRRWKYATSLAAFGEKRTSMNDLRVADGGAPIPLPESDSLLLFGWGLQLDALPKARRPLADADGLLELVVRHPDLDYLWRCCRRRDWRNWLVHAATAWRLIPTTRNRARPFAEIDQALLESRREEVWYALDPRAETLNVASLWCLFQDRIKAPSGTPSRVPADRSPAEPSS